METVRADIRSLPFKNESFDLAFCVSTIEHVGKDNSGYGVRTRAAAGRRAACASCVASSPSADGC